MNEYDTETNRDNLEEVIDQCTDDTSPVGVEDCVNEELGYINQTDLIE